MLKHGLNSCEFYDTSTRAYFRKKKRPGIGRFLKKCPSPEKLIFLNLNEKCQKQLLIRGTRPIPALLGYPNALLLNKGALLLKREALFATKILPQLSSF